MKGFTTSLHSSSPRRSRVDAYVPTSRWHSTAFLYHAIYLSCPTWRQQERDKVLLLFVVMVLAVVVPVFGSSTNQGRWGEERRLSRGKRQRLSWRPEFMQILDNLNKTFLRFPAIVFGWLAEPWADRERRVPRCHRMHPQHSTLIESVPELLIMLVNWGAMG